MRVVDQTIRLSAGDLTRHSACGHLTQLDRAAAEGRIDTPQMFDDPVLELLQQRGLRHEEAYIEHLREEQVIHEIVELRDPDSAEDAAGRTLDAMRSGAGAIVQATFQLDGWYGRADLLVRVETPSDLGGWSYEVVDTKLAQETKGGTVLQLCLYSDLLTQAQGCEPERMYVVTPGDGFPTQAFRFSEYAAYYRLVRRRLLDAVSQPPDEKSYPLPVPHCDLCGWRRRCDSRWREDDHLTLVAGMTAAHRTEFVRQGIETLEALAESDGTLPERPSRGSVETYSRLREQAAVQLKGRRDGGPVYELIQPAPERGLARLPEPAAGDVFFDIEGDPHVEEGGREYLLGYAYRDEGGAMAYQARWGRSPGEEKAAFEGFIDFVMELWERHPGMHVYHYAPYEPTAIKRLMSRHATRESEVDRLLRAGRFVDLYTVTRQGVRASVEQYSLKDLEVFSGYEREQDLRSVSPALRRVPLFLFGGDPDQIPDADAEAVERYNRDDCLSTARLRDWLERLRCEWESRGESLGRPALEDGAASDGAQDREAQVAEVYDALTADLDEDRANWSDADESRWLLAHQLEYFRREDKSTWWEHFRLHDTERDELFGERKALTGLRYEESVGGTSSCPVHRYSFPFQESSLRAGDDLHEVGGEKLGAVVQIDVNRRTIDIKKRRDAADVHPESVLVLKHIRKFPLDASVLELGRSVLEHGVDGDGPYQAARDLLRAIPPRLKTPIEGPLRVAGEDTIQSAVRLASELDGGVLPIQGPPGTGKTYTAAAMIAALAANGNRVGVTAVSHKVIRNLLVGVLEAAKRNGVPLSAVHKVSGDPDPEDDGVEHAKDNAAALGAVEDGSVVGGTAWLWAREDAAESLDYLFIDEAGQVSLVQALAAARSAKNLVLVGDPQQLEQPQQGAHPEGADVAALQHLIGESDTIAEERGLFLETTRRLHPEICAFTSEAYYEGRLRSLNGLENQSLRGVGAFDGAGLFFVPVEHSGNQNSSVEEVKAVRAAIDTLLQDGAVWTDEHGESSALTADDVLIVAPYNAQVDLLQEALPSCRVGTVDRFQGQEAPVVIYSMTSSSASEAPRGMGFLYSPNRLNVATSRARCASILIACPDVFEPECHTPRQMKWANGLCLYRERAREVLATELA